VNLALRRVRSFSVLLFVFLVLVIPIASSIDYADCSGDGCIPIPETIPVNYDADEGVSNDNNLYGAAMYFAVPSTSACTIPEGTVFLNADLDHQFKNSFNSFQSFVYETFPVGPTSTTIFFRNFHDLYISPSNYELFNKNDGCDIKDLVLVYQIFNKTTDFPEIVPAVDGYFSAINQNEADRGYFQIFNPTVGPDMMATEQQSLGALLNSDDLKVEGDMRRIILPLSGYCEEKIGDFFKYDVGDQPFRSIVDGGFDCDTADGLDFAGCEPFRKSAIGSCCSDRGVDEDTINPYAASPKFPSRLFITKPTALLYDRELEKKGDTEVIGSGDQDVNPWDMFGCYDYSLDPNTDGDDISVYRWGSFPEICAAKGGIVLGSRFDGVDSEGDNLDIGGWTKNVCDKLGTYNSGPCLGFNVDMSLGKYCPSCNFAFWSPDESKERDLARNFVYGNLQTWFDPYRGLGGDDYVDDFPDLTSNETYQVKTSFKSNSCCGDNPLLDLGVIIPAYRVKTVPGGHETSITGMEYTFVCAPSNSSDDDLRIMDAGFESNYNVILDLDVPFVDIGAKESPDDSFKYDLLAGTVGGFPGTSQEPDKATWYGCFSDYSPLEIWDDDSFNNDDNSSVEGFTGLRNYALLEYETDLANRGKHLSGNSLKKYMRPPYVDVASFSSAYDDLDPGNNEGGTGSGSSTTSGDAIGSNTVEVNNTDFQSSFNKVPCDNDGDGFFYYQDVRDISNKADCSHYLEILGAHNLDCDDENSFVYPGSVNGNCDCDCDGKDEDDFCDKPDEGQCVQETPENIDYEFTNRVKPYRFMCNGDEEKGLFVECCGHNKVHCVNKQYSTRQKVSHDLSALPYVSERRLRRSGSPLNTLFEFPCPGDKQSANCAYVVGVNKVPGQESIYYPVSLFFDMEMADLDINDRFFDFVGEEQFEFLNIIIKTSNSYSFDLNFADCGDWVDYFDKDSLNLNELIDSCSLLKVEESVLSIPLARYIVNGPGLNKWLHVKIPISALASGFSGERVDLLVLSQKNGYLHGLDPDKKTHAPASGLNGGYDNIFAIDKIYFSKSPGLRDGADPTQKDYYCTSLAPLGSNADSYDTLWVSDLDSTTVSTLEYGEGNERPLETLLPYQADRDNMYKHICDSIPGYKWTGTRCCGFRSGDRLSSFIYDSGSSDDREIFSDTQHGCLFSSVLASGARAAVVGYETQLDEAPIDPVFTFCYNSSGCVLPIEHMMPHSTDLSKEMVRNAVSVVTVLNKDHENVAMSIFKPNTDLALEYMDEEYMDAERTDQLVVTAPMSLLYFDQAFRTCEVSAFINETLKDYLTDDTYVPSNQCGIAAGYFCDVNKHQDYPKVSKGWNGEASGEKNNGATFIGEIVLNSEDEPIISSNEIFVARPYNRDTIRDNYLAAYSLYQPFGNDEFNDIEDVEIHLGDTGWDYGPYPGAVPVSEDVSNYSVNYYVTFYADGYLTSNFFHYDGQGITLEFDHNILADYSFECVGELNKINCTFNDLGVGSGLFLPKGEWESAKVDVNTENLDVGYVSLKFLMGSDVAGIKVDNIKIYYTLKEEEIGELEQEFGAALPAIGHQSSSCCPSDFCWTGQYCVAAELYERNASRDPKFISGDGSVGYRCVINQSEYHSTYAKTEAKAIASLGPGSAGNLDDIELERIVIANNLTLNASWVLTHKKYSWDRSKVGWCPYETQCLVDPEGEDWKYGYRNYANTDLESVYGIENSFDIRDLNPQCINDMQFIGDHLCYNGSWTTRTKMIADHLLDFYKSKAAEMGENVREASLYCADYSEVINDLKYSTGGAGEILEIISPDYCINTNDDSCATFGAQTEDERRSCGYASDDPIGDCINNVCVLRILSTGGVEETLVGTSLNIYANDTYFGFRRINMNYSDCGVGFGDSNYLDCGSDELAFMNGELMNIIFSDASINSDFMNDDYKTLFHKVVDWVRSLFYTVFGASLDYTTAENLRYFVRVLDFDDIFMLVHHPVGEEDNSDLTKEVMAYTQHVDPEQTLFETYYFRANFTNFDSGDVLCNTLMTYDYNSFMNDQGKLSVVMQDNAAPDEAFDDFVCSQKEDGVLIEGYWEHGNIESETKDRYRLFDASKKITARIRVKDFME
jgi:hypothetical protein